MLGLKRKCWDCRIDLLIFKYTCSTWNEFPMLVMSFEKCSDIALTVTLEISRDVDMTATKWPDVICYLLGCVLTLAYSPWTGTNVCPLINVCLEMVLFVINDSSMGEYFTFCHQPDPDINCIRKYIGTYSIFW